MTGVQCATTARKKAIDDGDLHIHAGPEHYFCFAFGEVSMRRLATIMIAAIILPVFGASPDEPQFSIILPFKLDLALPGFSEQEILSPRSRTAGDAVIRVRPSKCYYMGQINRNLQKPKEKPELVQLADAEVSPVPGNLNCLTRSLEPRATGR